MTILPVPPHAEHDVQYLILFPEGILILINYYDAITESKVIMPECSSSSQMMVISCQMVLLSIGSMPMPLLLLSSSFWPS